MKSDPSLCLICLLLLITMDSEKVEARNVTLQTFATVKTIQSQTANISKQPFKLDASFPPVRESMNFDCHRIEQESSCMDGYELEDYFLYAFASNQINTSKITLYTFTKEDGSQSKTTFKEFNSTITYLKIMLYIEDKLDQTPSRPKSASMFKLLIGTIDGFVKILDLQKPFSLGQIKTDVKPIQMILSGNYHHCSNQNVCIALASDSQIYIIDLTTNQIVYILKPTIIMCDSALSIAINQHYTHLLQSTQGGYLIFWKLDEVLAHLRDRKQGKLKSKEKIYSVFPVCCDHSMAKQGLLWCGFYGHLIILLTKHGVLKMTSLLFGPQSEYIQLLTFSVQDANSITSVQLFSDRDLVVMAKSKQKINCLQLLNFSSEFRIVSIRTIYIQNMDAVKDFYLTDQFNILMCRGNKCFVINQCPDITLYANKKEQY